MKHPGEILLEQFMTPRGLSQNRLARDLRIPPQRINEIVKGNRSVTLDTALRLSCYFDNSPSFWLDLQMKHDLDKAEDTGQTHQIYAEIRKPNNGLFVRGKRQVEISQKSLRAHRLIAQKLRKHPSEVIRRAKDNIEKWGWNKEPRPVSYMIAWKKLLNEPPEKIISVITSPGEKGTLLRSSSPFEGVLSNDEKSQLNG